MTALVLAGCCLVSSAGSNRSWPLVTKTLKVGTSGGPVAMPTLGYASAVLFLPPIGSPVIIKATTAQFPAVSIRDRSGRCIDSPQSEVLIFNHSLNLSYVPPIAFRNYFLAGSHLSYVLVDDRGSELRVIARAGTEIVTTGSPGWATVRFRSRSTPWNILAHHRYVFELISSAYTPYNCTPQ